MLISKNYQQMLDSKGVPLDEFGIREVALARDDALRAKDFPEKRGVDPLFVLVVGQ